MEHIPQFGGKAVHLLIHSLRVKNSKGGFPEFLLQPINFDALYAQGMAQAQSQVQSQVQPASGGSNGGGNGGSA